MVDRFPRNPSDALFSGQTVNGFSRDLALSKVRTYALVTVGRYVVDTVLWLRDWTKAVFGSSHEAPSAVSGLVGDSFCELRSSWLLRFDSDFSDARGYIRAR